MTMQLKLAEDPVEKRWGIENIFHNAGKIKSIMKKNETKKGYMNYSDPPTFDSTYDWEKGVGEENNIQG